MERDDNILGCFVSGPTIDFDAGPKEEETADEQGRLFRRYIWGDGGVEGLLKKLKYEDYGNDLKLVLFQFIIKPHPLELQSLHDIERYRRNEKSVGISIIVTDENFFLQDERNRRDFLVQSILQKSKLLEEVIKKERLDTNLDLLIADLQELLT